MEIYNSIYNFEPLWGSWKIDRLIGYGSIGDVYRITKKVYSKEYVSALKFIRIPTKDHEMNLFQANKSYSFKEIENFYSDIVKNITSEIDMLYQLKGHSNIINYEDHIINKIKNQNKWFIMIRMEYANTLNSYLKSNSFNQTDVINLGLDMCSALEICHSKNILHRDIKEANIFVTKEKNYKLGDFSVSKELFDTTNARTKIGTTYYMPPEIINNLNYDKTIDIYSLGLVLYKLLNNDKFPFMDDDCEFTRNNLDKSYLRRISGEQLPNPKYADKEFSEIIFKACAYEPNNRYQSASEFKEALIKRKYQLQQEVDIDIKDFKNYTTTNNINNNSVNDIDYNVIDSDNFNNSNSKNPNSIHEEVTDSSENINLNNKIPIVIIPIIITSIIIFLILVYVYLNAKNSTQLNNNTEIQKNSSSSFVVPNKSTEISNGNLVKNFNAESINSDWSVFNYKNSKSVCTFSKDYSYNGDYSLSINKTNTYGRSAFKQTISVTKNLNYKLSFYTKVINIAEDNSKGACAWIEYKNSKGQTKTISSSYLRKKSSWQLNTINFSPASDTIILYVGVFNQRAFVCFDNIELIVQ